MVLSFKPANSRLTLRVLAHLLRYPDAAMRAHAAEMAQALQEEGALPAARRQKAKVVIGSPATAASGNFTVRWMTVWKTWSPKAP